MAARSFADRALEAQARAAVRLDEASALLDRFSSLVRESGTPDEEQASRYIQERLRALGVPFTVYTPELYLSLPERSEVRVIDGEDVRPIASRPPAFSRSTNGEAVTGELCYLSAASTAAAGSLAEPWSTVNWPDLTGKIVLTEGFTMRGPMRAFEDRGAVGQIYVHPGEHIHEGICTTVWGAPTAESLSRKPRTPIVSVNRPDGERLIALATAGPGCVSIRTWLREGWTTCSLPVVEIAGQEDPDEFLLVHGHYDSWYVGIGDNATGNAALLEIARVLNDLRTRLKRSVRIAWWPGHSIGRYAGSTWYADTFADELDQRCVAHLNIDSPGCAGATVYDEMTWMAEAAGLCTAAVADSTGQLASGGRALRAGDYSFNQIGATGFYMLFSNIPAAERGARGFYPVGGCAGNIAWHTPGDIMAVADLGVLERDLHAYVTTILRVINAPLHPFDYAATVAEIAEAVAQYDKAADGTVDLEAVLTDLRALGAAIEAWRAAADAHLHAHPQDARARRRFNGTLRRLARTLVPLNYSRGERFDHDPALKLPAVPRLAAALSLASAPAQWRAFIRTGLVRERNKVRAMLRAALRELDESVG